MTVTSHPLADDYLRSLDRAARVLPRSQRTELVAEIRGHIDAGLTPGAGESDVRNLLDALGPPADIVAAARPDQNPSGPLSGIGIGTRCGAREVFALILLVTGIPPVFGWLVGLGLLLSSPLWSARQKLLGALVWPGGFTGFTVAVLYFGLSPEAAVAIEIVCFVAGLGLVLWSPLWSARQKLLGALVWPGGFTGFTGFTVAVLYFGLLPEVAVAIEIVFFVAPLLVAAYLYQAAGRLSQEG